MNIELGLELKNKEGKIGTVIDLIDGKEKKVILWFYDEKIEKEYTLSNIEKEMEICNDRKDVLARYRECIVFKDIMISTNENNDEYVTLVAGLKVYNKKYGIGRITDVFKSYARAIPIMAVEVQFENALECFPLPYNIWGKSHIMMDPGFSVIDGGLKIVSNLAPESVRYIKD